MPIFWSLEDWAVIPSVPKRLQPVGFSAEIILIPSFWWEVSEHWHVLSSFKIEPVASSWIIVTVRTNQADDSGGVHSIIVMDESETENLQLYYRWSGSVFTLYLSVSWGLNDRRLETATQLDNDFPWFCGGTLLGPHTILSFEFFWMNSSPEP